MTVTTLTPEETAVYQAQLAEAMSAWHSLQIGGAVREFTDQNGEKVAYSQANPTRLLSYINWLRGMLGMCPLSGFVGRPIGVYL